MKSKTLNFAPSKPETQNLENPFDTLFFRPLARFFVLWSIKLSITPNQLSLLCLLSGLLAALLYSLNFHPAFSSFLILLCLVLDCADGQLARQTQSFSPYGSVIDGISDYSIATTVFLALIYHPNAPDQFLFLGYFSGFSMFFQCYFFNIFKYQALDYDKPLNSQFSFHKVKSLTSHSFQNRQIFSFLFNGILMIYLFVSQFVTFSPKQQQQQQHSFRSFLILKSWPILGYTTQMLLVALALLLKPWFPIGIHYVLYFIAFPMNLLLLFLLVSGFLHYKKN